MRARFGMAVLAVGLLALGGCAGGEPEDDAVDDAFLIDGKADTGGVAEGTPEAAGVLRVANELSLPDLSNRAHVSRGAARAIVAARPLSTLAQLDRVPYVGPIAFARLLAYARSAGYVTAPPVSGGSAGKLISTQFISGDRLGANVSGSGSSGTAIAVDATGNVVLGAQANFVTGPGGATNFAAILKVQAADASVQWSSELFPTSFPTSAAATAVAVGAGGNVLAGGRPRGTAARPKVVELSPAGASNWMVEGPWLVAASPSGDFATASDDEVKLWSADHVARWSFALRGVVAPPVRQIRMDAQGEVVVLAADGERANVLRLRRDGTVRWQKSVGATRGAVAASFQPWALDVDATTGSVLLAGDTSGVGGLHGLWVRLDADGNERWRDATLDAVPTESSLRAIAASPEGGVVVAGYVRRWHQVPITEQQVLRQHLYVAAYSASGTPVWTDEPDEYLAWTGRGLWVQAPFVYLTGDDDAYLFLRKYRL